MTFLFTKCLVLKCLNLMVIRAEMTMIRIIKGSKVPKATILLKIETKIYHQKNEKKVNGFSIYC